MLIPPYAKQINVFLIGHLSTPSALTTDVLDSHGFSLKIFLRQVEAFAAAWGRGGPIKDDRKLAYPKSTSPSTFLRRLDIIGAWKSNQICRVAPFDSAPAAPQRYQP